MAMMENCGHWRRGINLFYLLDSRMLAVPAHDIRLLCNRMIMALSLIDAIMHYVSKTLNMQMDDEEAQFSLERKYLRVQVITCPCFFLSSLNFSTRVLS